MEVGRRPLLEPHLICPSGFSSVQGKAGATWPFAAAGHGMAAGPCAVGTAVWDGSAWKKAVFLLDLGDLGEGFCLRVWFLPEALRKTNGFFVFKGNYGGGRGESVMQSRSLLEIYLFIRCLRNSLIVASIAR